MSVAVVDYGVGNLGSVLNMFRRVGVPAHLVSSPEDVAKASRLLLPGVGAFDRGMSGLRAHGLDHALVAAVAAGNPVLGICLGMQLLTRASEEGSAAGLGLLDADCHRILPGTARLRVPHMGWNWVDPSRPHPLLAEDGERRKFYFAHSFHVVPDRADDLVATTPYGESVAAVVGTGNVVGAQFHPEKSHAFGMRFLEAFAQWSP